MSEFGYFLTGAGIGLAVGFHVACMIMKQLIKDEPEKFAQVFKKKSVSASPVAKHEEVQP